MTLVIIIVIIVVIIPHALFHHFLYGIIIVIIPIGQYINVIILAKPHFLQLPLQDILQRQLRHLAILPEPARWKFHPTTVVFNENWDEPCFNQEQNIEKNVFYIIWHMKNWF